MPRARLVALLACPLVLPLALTGCTTAVVDNPADGVSVQLAQFRSDVTDRRLQLRVVNDGDSEITIGAASLESDGLSEPARWSGGSSRVPAGGARDLPVILPAPDCDDSGAAVTVALTLESPEAMIMHVTPADELDVLASVLRQDCFDLRVAERVTITPAAAIRTETRDGELVALLDLDFEPTQPVTLLAVRGTNLLYPSSGASTWPFDTELTDARTITLDIVPTRCDPHAVAEDKRGTLFPVELNLGDGQGLMYVPVSDDVRGQLYDFVAAHCGWPAS
ncbi:hypothetical protein [Diaminobutyricimonas sp. LJ205]|uniref:hypothetical protein n=1 Tax=Diaminobutyricimonas sp. LJ205 TaxID=2683590 RepID=UPI0012F4997B|nr:hypothetical protein [Diaminobutyricimonas sp. LJ205]